MIVDGLFGGVVGLFKGIASEFKNNASLCTDAILETI